MQAEQHARGRIWAALTLIAALLLAGCASDRRLYRNARATIEILRLSATPRPSRTPRLTPTPTPTRTPRPTATPPRSGHLADLLASGEVAMRARGAGIDELELDLQDLVEEILDVEVPAGTYFVAQSRGVQDMVVRTTTVIRLEDNDWLSTLLDVACAALERDVPDEEDTFTVERSPRQEELTRLMPVLESSEAGYDVEQAAIWIVTDDANYEDLGRLRAGLMGRVIDLDDATAAMLMVDQAGIDITEKAIWEDREDIRGNVEDRGLWEWLRDRDPETRTEEEAWQPSGGMTLPQRGAVEHFAFSFDGTLLATTGCSKGPFLNCEEGEISLWRTQAIWEADAARTPVASVSTEGVHGALAFSPDGSLLASAVCTDYRPPDCRASEIHLWDVPSMEGPQILAGPKARVSHLQFSPDGDLLIVAFCTLRGSLGCQDWQVQLWDAASGDMVRALAEVDSPGMRFTPDGHRMVGEGCVDWDRTSSGVRLCARSEVRFWDPNTGEVARRLSPHMRLIMDLALSPDGQYLAVSGTRHDADGLADMLLVFDLTTEQVVGQTTLAEEERWCANLSMAPDGSLVAGAACNSDADHQVEEIRLWQIPSAKLAGTIAIQPEPFLRLEFSPDGQTLGILGYERSVLNLERVVGQ